MRIESRWALALLAVACVAGLNSCATARNPNSSTAASMWVATAGDQMARSYSISLTTGAVSQTGNAVATGAQPQAMAITPDGKTLFIANGGDNSISGYVVNSDGTLGTAAKTTSSGQLPVALAIDPTGKILFAADQQSGDISAYTISSTSLTAVGTVPTQTAASPVSANPSALAVSPGGNFLYVANSATDEVLGFAYDGSGVLTPLPSANPNPCGVGAPGYCVQVGTNPSGLAFSRCAGITAATAVCATADASNLFVSNAGSNNISIFSACLQISATCATPNGTLTPLSTNSTVAACCGPTIFLIDPTADLVYVLERGTAQVGQFRYSPATGALTALSPSFASTGASPFSAGISSNTSNSKWVFVTNSGASTISGFSVSSGGTLVGLSSGPFPISGQPTAILVR